MALDRREMLGGLAGLAGLLPVWVANPIRGLTDKRTDEWPIIERPTRIVKASEYAGLGGGPAGQVCHAMIRFPNASQYDCDGFVSAVSCGGVCESPQVHDVEGRIMQPVDLFDPGELTITLKLTGCPQFSM